MDIRIQIFVSIILLLSMVAILNMIRKKALELKYALAWLFVGFGVILATVFPGLTQRLSEILGIDSPINMLFFLGFCFSLAIIFLLTVAISRMSKRIKELAQKVALMEKGYIQGGNEDKPHEVF